MADQAKPGSASRNSKSRILAVSLKAYMLPHETHMYMDELATLSRSEGVPANVQVYVLPDFLALYNAHRIFAHTPVQTGAQDCSPHSPGPHTGDVTCTALRAAGASLVEIGHAEHRAAGDTNELFVRKARAAAQAGMTVLLCIGETIEPSPSPATWADDAVPAELQEVYGQIAGVLSHLDGQEPVILAYEPVWAIGAADPASADHIRRMTRLIRKWHVVKDWGSRVKVIYGGTAGPGLYEQIKEDCDGLFVGRRGHKAQDLWALVKEVGDA